MWRERLVVVEQRVGVDEVAVRDLATDERSSSAIAGLRLWPQPFVQTLAR